MIETDQEFTDGLSPRVEQIDPRLPTQHTLDAHQLRVLHRAIDTLAFTAEQYRGLGDPYAKALGDLRWLEQTAATAHSVEAPDDYKAALRSEARDKAGRIRLAIIEARELPRGVAELIDATTSAWQPIMAELIEQQARFNRGD